MTARVLAGESQDAVITELNDRGVLTSYSKPWTRAGLRQVLTRPRNAGHVTYRGRTVGKTDGEPLIEPETFERLVALYASRRRGRPVSAPYLCSGVARCGVCGHTLSGRPRAHLSPYSDGQVRRQYWCQPRVTNGGCGRISIDQRDLDQHVAALVIRILSDPRHAATVEAAARVAVDERHRLDGEIGDIEHTALELAGRLGRGEITLSRFDAATGPLDRRLCRVAGTARRDRHRGRGYTRTGAHCGLTGRVVEALAGRHRGRAANTAPAGATRPIPGRASCRSEGTETV